MLNFFIFFFNFFIPILLTLAIALDKPSFKAGEYSKTSKSGKFFLIKISPFFTEQFFISRIKGEIFFLCFYLHIEVPFLLVPLNTFYLSQLGYQIFVFLHLCLLDQSTDMHQQQKLYSYLFFLIIYQSFQSQ